MTDTQRVLCKVCGIHQADDAEHCSACHDGPFCRYCLVLRHGIHCNRRRAVVQVLRWLGLWRCQLACCTPRRAT